jgi:hypothetical protein
MMFYVLIWPQLSHAPSDILQASKFLHAPWSAAVAKHITTPTQKQQQQQHNCRRALVAITIGKACSASVRMSYGWLQLQPASNHHQQCSPVSLLAKGMPSWTLQRMAFRGALRHVHSMRLRRASCHSNLHLVKSWQPFDPAGM